MSYSPKNFGIAIFVYVYDTSPKIECPWGIAFSQQGVIFKVSISNISAISTKRRFTK